MDDHRLFHLFRRLDIRDTLSADEKQALAEAAGNTVQYSAGSDMSSEGDSPDRSQLLIGGMAARYNRVESGDRQITAFHIAGDFVDLHGFLLARLDHGVSAVTDVTVVEFPHVNLTAVTERFPHLTRLLWLSTLLDGAIHRQWLVAMGRLSALSHMAHLFCEHYLRADTVALAAGMSFPFNITQEQLADALGLSTVHVNRTIQELRRLGLISWDGRTVTIHDWERLQQVGQFDPTFLDLTRSPR
ncbi:MAG TPA: Crp/Fnr family transcriptional regulator [Devosia sp.]|jgi:CRP-like cAMP-binding protein|uniref:Crp/Fnr family transcriptional regulator n=1 Tax=Devosia sp. TaxID=1871048 RepID=UPI002F947048